MAELSAKTCIPCEGGTEPLSEDQAQDYLQQVHDDWHLEEGRLKREFAFRDFKSALAFTNSVGEIAEKEGHHPDIFLTYGQVVIKLWTHAIGGLSENDFILAAKIDAIA